MKLKNHQLRKRVIAHVDKPLYRVPSMVEIAALPKNGFKVVSTFSGCGGSCLGFEMAGFTILYANEFIPAAREVYKLNHKGVFLDDRDIRQVQPEDILAKIGMAKGELDVMEGSPPCASFSTAGDRESGWGKVKKYSDTEQRTDDLFFEFIRLLNGIQPKVFVAENVSGLVKGTAKGYFIEILRELKKCGYRVGCQVLDAQWLGVPQARQRTIFMGVREDLGREPVFPVPLGYRYSLRDALPWLTKAKYGPDWKKPLSPSPTVSASRNYSAATSKQGLELVEARIIGGTGAAFEDKMKEHDLGVPAPTITTKPNQFEVHELSIDGYAIAKEWDKLKPGESSKRYFNLVKPDANEPSPTICAAHGTQGVASVTHPVERRKLTIGELKRICAFPDDFELVGSYAQQWERLGRAVPPVMMKAVAECVLKVLS